MNEFKMTKMGSLRYLLGIEVDLVPGKVLAFRQRRYLDKVIEQFGSQDMQPVEIPMAVSWEPKELNDHDEPTNKVNDDFLWFHKTSLSTALGKQIHRSQYVLYPGGIHLNTLVPAYICIPGPTCSLPSQPRSNCTRIR